MKVSWWNNSWDEDTLLLYVRQGMQDAYDEWIRITFQLLGRER